MTIAKVARWLLALAAVLVVVWAFVDVGKRSFKRWDQARNDTRTELTILHWGDNVPHACNYRECIGESGSTGPSPSTSALQWLWQLGCFSANSNCRQKVSSLCGVSWGFL